LLALGVTGDQLRWWVHKGQVAAIARGVYSPTSWLSTMADDPRRMHAVAVGAMIKRNPDLVASHESAAYLHGIDGRRDSWRVSWRLTRRCLRTPW